MGLTVQFRCGSCQEQISWKQLSDYEQCPYCGKRLADTVQLCCANCGEPVTWEPQLIRSRTVFKYYCDFAGMGQKIQVGTYTLKKNMTMAQIADRLTTGDGNPLVRNITLIPGETVEAFAARLVRNGVLESADTFLALCRDGQRFREYYYVDDVITGGKPESRKYVLEGYLAPDTYEVYTNAAMEDIIKKLLSQTEAVFKTEYHDRAEQLNMTMDQVITLASMIEKEAKNADFAKVSAVFHNRLRQNMALGSDVTVKYASGVKRMALTNEDLKVNSPYNTYTNLGLPIGPICSPSAAAIQAALYPDEQFMADGYLYFCSKDPNTGELHFSRTLEEHELAVSIYAPLWQAFDKEKGL
jgi:UPF0755 protein